MTTIYFATNRNPDRKRNPRDFGTSFNREAPHNMRYGVAHVAKNGRVRLDIAGEIMSSDPKRVKLGSNEVFASLTASMKKGRDTLIYVHGYATSFESAIKNGAELSRIYDKNVVVFSWPSDGSLFPILAYKNDRTDARLSAAAFARGLMRLYDFLKGINRGQECGADIHLMCHSMGNYVMRHGLQEMRRIEGYLPRMFDRIFLMAADEDYDTFERDHKLGPLHEMGNMVHVYFNSGDTALVVSDKTKQNPTRLGSRGPRSPHTVPGNVEIVDASQVVGGIMEHDYYKSEARVIQDVTAVLGGESGDDIAGRRYVASRNSYVLT